MILFQRINENWERFDRIKTLKKCSVIRVVVIIKRQIT